MLDTKQVEFRIIDANHSDYEKMQTLRDEVLRKPQGAAFTPQEIEDDKQFSQVVGYCGGTLCATAMLADREPNKLRIQRVAVKEGYQSKGIGKAMMTFCENYAEKNGYKEIYVHARESAVQFYLDLGYTAEGVYFEEAKIPHLKMRKRL